MQVIYVVALVLLWIFQIVTLVIAWSALRKSPFALQEKIEGLELMMSDIEMRHESLHASHKRLNSRVAMAKARESRGNGAVSDSGSLSQLPGETDSEWKARMRKKIVSGELKHHD